MEVECFACGRLNPVPAATSGHEVSVICRDCGAQFEVPIPLDTGAEAVSPSQSPSETVILDSKASPASPRLSTVVQGFLTLVGAMPGEDRFQLVKTRTVVGRKGADIVIDDSALSSQHFEVEARGDEFFIRDLDSTNGTKLNGQLISAPARLENGGRIEAGETTFVFRTLETIPWSQPE